MLTLLIGGARSGKSKFAESLCAHSKRVVYIATARVEDKEMSARIARHRQDRPANWLTIEEPLCIDVVLCQAAIKYEVLLVDCLTVWLSNLLYHHRRRPASEIEAIMLSKASLIAEAAPSRHVILVSNEVGAGIVPSTKVARLFRDLQGQLNQYMAASADQVFLLAAGIPLQIKPERFYQPILERSNYAFEN